MKTATLITACLLLSLTACQSPENYRGPSIGLNLGFEEFSVGVTLFSSLAPAAATLTGREPTPAAPVTVTPTPSK